MLKLTKWPGKHHSGALHARFDLFTLRH